MVQLRRRRAPVHDLYGDPERYCLECWLQTDQTVLRPNHAHGAMDDPDSAPWLFLGQGSNRALAMFQGETLAKKKQKRWTALLADRADWAATLGLRYVNVVVPDRIGLFAERVPVPITEVANYPGQRLLSALRKYPNALHHHLDLYQTIREHPNREELFWRTDTHWNTYGAFVAYQAICERLGLTFVADLLDPNPETELTVRDLGQKVRPRVRELITKHRFEPKARREWCNPLVSFKEARGLTNEMSLHGGSMVTFTNEYAPNAQHLMIFGDSYAEYRQHLLTGLLAESCQRTTFIWSGGVDRRLVERTRPDILVTEKAERFLYTVHPDHVDVTALAEQRIASYLATHPDRPSSGA